MTATLVSTLAYLKALGAGPVLRELSVEFISPGFFYEFFSKEVIETWEGGPPEMGWVYFAVGLFYLSVLLYFLWRFRFLDELKTGWAESRRRRDEVRRLKAEKRARMKEAAASLEGVSYDGFHALAAANRAFEEGRLEDALSAYDEAGRSMSGLSAAWVGRGAALARLGRTDEARGAFGRALEIEPANAEALVNMGLLALVSGETESARETFERALALDGASARGHLGLTLLAARLGERAEAERHLKRAFRLKPSLAQEASREPSLKAFIEGLEVKVKRLRPTG
jgi:Flp pilus assembly protein TadD